MEPSHDRTLSFGGGITGTITAGPAEPGFAGGASGRDASKPSWPHSNVDGVADMVQRARADPQAFGELYDAYFSRIYGYVAAQLRSRADAEDVVADAFVRALDKLPQLSALGERVLSFTQQGNADSFVVRLAIPISEATERFAQQIFTAMLTLVTAVASFYFASRTAETGVPKAPSADLAVTKVEPESEATSKGVVPLAIEGRGFAAPASVQLRRRSQPPIDASLIQVVDPTKIKCQVDISKAEKGRLVRRRPKPRWP